MRRFANCNSNCGKGIEKQECVYLEGCPATTEIANLDKHNRNGDKVYSSLRLSYEHLEGDEVKSLCLLFGLFSSYIDIRDLLKYGVVTARKIASEQRHVFTHQKTTVRVEEWPRIDELQKVT
ncbi:hypothetical protein CK203_110789 [Vitis vinifera]|uniref:Uncharacterized protein n=1 Tax=Vitis vinifera TaxID=29760 RepID=A0A438FE61_VITVI|nr:hypothetical protein CK203_110789 [Vitis vinifera]